MCLRAWRLRHVEPASASRVGSRMTAQPERELQGEDHLGECSAVDGERCYKKQSLKPQRLFNNTL
eukprot:355296-Chlamydomonas_euryale.AAC.2